MEIPYVRISTTYFKKVKKPLSSGDETEILILWNKDTIISDYGRDYLAKIECYDGFCSIPSHTNYKPTVGTFYNQYHELEYKPLSGECLNILSYMKHIFGQQYELGLDYMKILYEHPLQALPVLCLVSSERGTGKTTFINLLKFIFGKNMTLNTNDDFRSQFNSDWANRLLIAVDEVLLDKKEDSERIKNLSTARQFKAEAKGKDRQEVEFYGKFILCSNNETTFIFIDNQETRYWVRKIQPFKDELKCTSIEFLELLKSEIPAFLQYLLDRQFYSENKSRMWFTPKQIETEALIRLKSNNKSLIEKEMIDVLEIIFEDKGVDIIQFQLQDFTTSMHNLHSRNYSSNKIKEILSQNWHLCTLNSSYTQHIIHSDGTIKTQPHKGRFYELTLERFSELNY